MDNLPLSSSGKVDRSALPLPRNISEQHAAKSEPPVTEIEKQLASIWCEVLGQDSIGRNDNFFDHGGVSLGAIQVMARVRDMFGIELPVQTFFSAPTIAAVAQNIEELLVADIAAMSDDEVEHFLREEEF
jgi:acyl carrier protein